MGKHRDELSKTARAAAYSSGDLNLVALAKQAGGERIQAPDIEKVRAALRTRREAWRSFEQVLETDGYKKSVEDEFPDRRSLLSLDRRDFLKFVGASTVMAGLAASGCRNLPEEKIVPYVKAPEEFVPGKPVSYATTYVHGGYGIGVLAESHMGRPTKLEGNPDHPSSLGATDHYTQAAVWGLYDPDRSQNIQTGKDVATWDNFFLKLREAAKANPGGFRILAETTTSPSLLSMLDRVKARFPGCEVYHYEAVNQDNALEGARLAFGKKLEAVYDFAAADVIVTLDADPFAELPGRVRYSMDFGARRDPKSANLHRIYSAESYPTLIGALADHRAVQKPGEVTNFARALAAAVGIQTVGTASAPGVEWFAKLVSELQGARGRSIVIAGQAQPADVHALAFAINAALGNMGTTVGLIEPLVPAERSNRQSLKELIEAMKGNQVSSILILGGNPVFTAPADSGFKEALANVPLKAYWGLYQDETSAVCDWHVPALHFLESWGDARAHDGTVSLIQPLISPLYAGRSAHELLEGLLGGARKQREIVRAYWSNPTGSVQTFAITDDKAWQAALEKGFIANSAADFGNYSVQAVASVGPTASNGLEVVFLPDPSQYDGRFANCPWLQELPKPFTTLTWDNTAQISPRTASRLNLASHDIVEMELNGRKVQGPVWVTPGMADETVVIHYGYGRTMAGPVGNGTGFNAYEILPSLVSGYAVGTAIAASGITLTKVGSNFPLAATQTHNQMEGRDIARVGTVADLAANPSLAPPNAYHKDEKIERNLYNPEEFAYDGHKWAMTIDLNKCIGCNACVMACQTENNIPSVGKEQVIRGRELHWIRVDTYYQGELDAPSEVLFQPLPCMHCEQAPCEPVCPVAATTHSAEGLNQMVYNRCVGTRYCSNNCPYKVRRFNYINYGDRHDYPSTEDNKKPAPTLRLLQNPDVTVRGRGVMEKCTYCVQRINQARIEAKKEGRRIRDGEVVPACAQACPTRTIVFGDIGDPDSAVNKTRADQRNYMLLEEINTKPRTTYLGKVKNPNATA